MAGRVGRGLGAYGVQAAIAECHAIAPSVDQTDWERIVVLYEALGRLAPSPVVELNHAVATSMASGPAAALPIVDALDASGGLAGSHLLPSVRGELRAREARQRTELDGRRWAGLRDGPLARGRAADDLVARARAWAARHPWRPDRPA